MLTHYKDPRFYAHFSLTSLWPREYEFIVISLTKCLRDFEGCIQDNTQDISLDQFDHLNPLFQEVMDPTTFKVGYLNPQKIKLTTIEVISFFQLYSTIKKICTSCDCVNQRRRCWSVMF